MASSLVRMSVSTTANPIFRRLVKPSAVSFFNKRLNFQSRFISTSKKNKDAVAAGHHHVDQPVAPAEKLEKLEDKEENWISYGYSLVDRDSDEFSHHIIFFGGITICICFGSFLFAYFPDYKDVAWTQREAYLELERRRAAGKPLIDANLIDPAKIQLPDDEELGNYEIIV
ncbi:hypothetical protein HELRODRAFT_161570 [Helobdella robusta]|uniref:NADH dehydrogenase [ubiquinone] 1 beta subcomplex subunit 11, mitochondrial n=1 Tax=Helobdella robusta TaxID=6412 RepID=T1ERM6_HELRO|nr:hypothetical protein HELRODRAFT_161570 [Helobdella robusta]ESO02315.1 hypothetical protein HELRODRAFT_161570 [Helobdella robusta]